MIEPAIVISLATLAVGIVAAFALTLLPTMRLQVVGLALLAVVLPLAAVLLSGWVMFHMGADVKILAVACGSATAAVGAAVLLAHAISRPIDRLRTTSYELAEGDLRARAPESGPRELAELGAAFNEMAVKLERLFDARRKLVAWASHDLRTPVASIQAMLEALEDGLVEPETYLPALHEQVRRLSALLDDLFELARIDATLLTVELRESSIEPMVESCVRALEPEARAKQVQLTARVDRPVAAWCAPDKVERVLFNLLTNSLRHTPTDGSVAVVVEPDTTEVRITVEDTGEGIAPDLLGQVFDRFWRGDRARTGPSAGLGLAIAQGLVEAQGGRIWAEPRPGGGARVSFTLPAAA
jgi:signal transduction histidine kinase